MIKKIAVYLIKADKIFLFPILISFLTVLAIITPLLLFYNRLPPQLPLFYSLPWGNSQLADKQQFFILPGIITIISLLNILISSQLHSSQIVLKTMLMFSLVLIDLTIAITALKIFAIFI